MTHPNTNLCCAAVPGATEDVTSRTLAALDSFTSSQPAGAWKTDRLPYTRRAAKAHVRKTAFPAMSWIAWLLIQPIVNAIISWYINRRLQECPDEDSESPLPITPSIEEPDELNLYPQTDTPRESL